MHLMAAWRLRRIRSARSLLLAASLVTAVAAARASAQTTVKAAPLARADQLVAAGQVDAARVIIEQVLADDPESAAAHDRLGFVLGLQGRTEEALQPLRCRQAMRRSAASAISAVEPA